MRQRPPLPTPKRKSQDKPAEHAGLQTIIGTSGERVALNYNPEDHPSKRAKKQ